MDGDKYPPYHCRISITTAVVLVVALLLYCICMSWHALSGFTHFGQLFQLLRKLIPIFPFLLSLSLLSFSLTHHPFSHAPPLLSRTTLLTGLLVQGRQVAARGHGGARGAGGARHRLRRGSAGPARAETQLSPRPTTHSVL
jgi:hypothetical protein